jgi:hypothetical protein
VTPADKLAALRAEHARLCRELLAESFALGRSALQRLQSAIAKVADKIVALELAAAKAAKSTASGRAKA